jgi:uncharacterized SAM-binding protein YcdF (DUF218 family)
MAQSKSKNTEFLKILRIFAQLSGIIFIAALILAFTTLPFWGIHWLGTSKTVFDQKPSVIILLGGGGMPSESNLMRSWFTAKAAGSFPDAQVIIAMPGSLSDSLSTPHQIENELTMRGVNPKKIQFENRGKNTRAQALNCAEITDTSLSVLLVTSPEHTRRSVLSFQKAGFEQVNALPAFENVSEADLKFSDRELGGREIVIPGVGKNMQMRYQIWNHLKYEVSFMREILALGYYKLRGWI